MTEKTDQILNEIKRLLVLILVKKGMSSDEIGAALNVSGARIRQQFKMNMLKKKKVSKEVSAEKKSSKKSEG